MEDKNEVSQVTEENEVDVQNTKTRAEELVHNIQSTWSNGQCIAAMPSRSAFNPIFDLSLSRTKLERNGFKIPRKDLETPLKAALNAPPIRRYMVFNSGLFHFIMAPILYVVIWCAVFSTLRLYIAVSDYWVLCLSVSLVSIFLTTAIIFMLHHSNKEININIDVRLVQVNERMAKYKLLVGVADWVENCTGNMRLYFVYWDISQCLSSLTETLEELSFVTADIQAKMKTRMSHLILVTEAPPEESDFDSPDASTSLDEHRPLLREEGDGRSSFSHQKQSSKATCTLSLLPEASLPPQVKAYQLLMTYSAVYVKLLMSRRLSGPSDHRMRLQRNHCSTAPICLCQYISKKILQ